MTGSRPAAAQDPPEELVRRAALGDVEAFARIVRLHNADMTQVAFVIVADEGTAVGAADAAWIGAWHRLRRKRTPEGLGPWLCSLAAAEAVRIAKRGSDPGAGAPAPEGRPAGHAADDGLARALDRLGPEDRALLALRHVAGLSTAELAHARRRSRPPVPVRLEQLWTAVDGRLPPGSDLVELEARVERRLRAYANVPVRQVDADAVARRARAEESLERTRMVSVAISAVVGVLVAVHPYVARLIFGR